MGSLCRVPRTLHLPHPTPLKSEEPDDIGGTAITSCVGTVADGATIDTATTGTKTFTATVTNIFERLTTVTHSYTVTKPPARPDARVRKGTKGTLVGIDVDGSAARWTVRGAAQVGRSVAYTMSAQNDAAIADSFRLKGQGSKSGYTVRYTDDNGRNITASVVIGSYRTARLAPGKTATITVKVTVTTKATSSLAATIMVRSTTQPARTDTVKVVTSRR